MKKLLLLLLLFFSYSTSHASVVCIHGFFLHHRTMYPIAKALSKQGMEVYVWSYPSRKKTIECHAKYLVDTLNYIAEINPGEPIDFVAHSIGGLILRAALNLPNCPQEAKIGKAVLIATPNRGASLARHVQRISLIPLLLGSKSGRELMLYNEYDIYHLGFFPKCMEVLVIAGCKGSSLFFKVPNDGLVAVEETVLESDHKHLTLPNSHGKLLKDKAAIYEIKKFLCNQ